MEHECHHELCVPSLHVLVAPTLYASTAPSRYAVAVRLANVSSAPSNVWMGRLEVQRQGIWLPACATRLTTADATIACRQMKLGTVGRVVAGSTYGPGAGGVWLEGLGCKGTEPQIGACPGIAWGSTKCPGHRQDAGLVCSGLTRECHRTSRG